jgi:hypothetical protein
MILPVAQYNIAMPGHHYLHISIPALLEAGVTQTQIGISRPRLKGLPGEAERHE